jgi:hypothetical protein
MKVTKDPREASNDHHRAVREFVAAARAVDADRWERPLADGKWTPAQVAEHMRLSYEVFAHQLAGGQGLRVRTSWWQRRMLRWKFLGGILQQGVLPVGARAPREVRPGDGPFDRDATLLALEEAAAEAESRLVKRWSDPSCVMTHHVFGDLRPPEGMRLATVHTRHHARQIAPRAGAE